MKAKIIQIGGFDERGMPTGWHFDCRNGAIGLQINEPLRVAGYTLAELRAISER